MPILELPPNPSQSTDSEESRANQSVKVRTGRFGELEEHELIHLLDSLDDERSRSRFRESIYISVIIYLALAWFLFYGPRILFHQPQFQDPIALMKQHDRELTFLNQRPAPALKPPPHPVIDRKTMQQLQQQARTAAPAPAPAPQPQELAHSTTPPVVQPPLPMAPKPATDLPSAPHPNLAQAPPSAHSALQDAMRGAMSNRGGAEYGSAPGAAPLEAGATILSDTMGVDFAPFSRRLKHDIERNWEPLVPEEVYPPLLKKGIVVIRVTILSDGKIGSMILEGRSGDVALDKAAWGAIVSEGQFPPLPKDFHGPQIIIRMTFVY